ncbi:MAG: TlpA family protein disulfide reductase [Flavobacteriales bacterium]|jgi:thiol-disulfide isomerase/thioredoxin
MNKIVFVVLLSFLAPFQLLAQVGVSGLLKNHPNKNIYAFKTSDELSGKRILVDKVSTDNEGKFKMTLNGINETTRFFLVIGNAEGVFYAQPNSSYTISYFPNASESDFQKIDRSLVVLQFSNLAEDDSNNLIPAFNKDLYAFLDEHFYDFAIDKYRGSEAYRKKSTTRRGNDLGSNSSQEDSKIGGAADSVKFINWVEKFREEMLAKYAFGLKNPYFANFMRYSIAELELMSGISSKVLYEEYLMSQKVLLNNPAYMKFFNAFYDHCLENRKNITQMAIQKAINADTDPFKVVEILQKDSAFQSIAVGELAVLKGLKDLYNNKQFSRGAVRKSMEMMAERANTIEYRAIAADVIWMFTKGKTGHTVPDFTVFTPKLDRWRFDENVGQFTYFFFFADWCTGCKKEMLLLNKLQEKYKGDIRFVAINMDEDIADLKRYIQENRDQNFTFLFAGNNPEIREIFNLKSLPFALMVDAEGKVMYDYTRLPSEGLNLDLDKLQAMLRSKPGGNTWKDK